MTDGQASISTEILARYAADAASEIEGVRSLAVGKNQDGRQEIFGVGLDGAMYHNYQTVANGGWSGWFGMGGSFK